MYRKLIKDDLFIGQIIYFFRGGYIASVGILIEEKRNVITPQIANGSFEGEDGILHVIRWNLNNMFYSRYSYFLTYDLVNSKYFRVLK